ncbi:MAG: hypothetical protein R3F46_02685 [bacterium]
MEIRVLILAVLLAGICCACQPPFYPLENSQKYVPYLESVSAPEKVRVGEQFTISASLSTARDPALLVNPEYGISRGGRSFGFLSGVQDGSYRDGQFLEFHISTLLSDADSTADQVEFSFTYGTPGKAYFYLPGARHRRDGGVSFTELGVANSSYPRESGMIEYREIVVEVLP